MEMTKGDDKFFTERTTLDILTKIREDAKLQGHLEEREIAKKEIAALQSSIKTLSEKMNQSEERHQEEVTELRQALHDADERERKRDIRELEKKCSDLSDALSEQRRAKELAEKKFRHNNICITCILVLFALASILLTVKLFQFGNAQGKDYLTVLSVILNIVLFAVPISFQIVVGKPLDAHNFISKWLQKMLSKKYKKYGYDKDEEERLQNEYNEVMGTLDELKERISERIPIGV